MLKQIVEINFTQIIYGTYCTIKSVNLLHNKICRDLYFLIAAAWILFQPQRLNVYLLSLNYLLQHNLINKKSND